MERAAMQENEKAGDHASDSPAFFVCPRTLFPERSRRMISLINTALRRAQGLTPMLFR